MAKDFSGLEHHADDDDADDNSNAGFIENQADSEDWDSASNVSSCITQVDPDEFERYFSERDNRLFHSHGSSEPYPLPVDTPEQEVRRNRSSNLSEQR